MEKLVYWKRNAWKRALSLALMAALGAGTLFAQAAVSVDLVTDVLKATLPTGDGADDGTKSASLFSGPTWDDTEIRADFTYTDPDGKFGGRLQMRADNMSKAASGGHPVTLGYYGAWVKMGPVTLYGGNEEKRGQLNSYRLAVFDDFLRYKASTHNFGVFVPAIDISSMEFDVKASDADNLLKNAWSGSNEGGLLADIALGPAIISLAMYKPTFQSQTTGDATGSKLTFTGSDFTKDNSAGFNFGARFSLAKVGGLLDFDGIYKVAATGSKNVVYKYKVPTGIDADENVIYEDKSEDIDKESWSRHVFGAFLGIKPLDGKLALAVGYSGRAEGGSSTPAEGDETKYVYPFYNGIDLHVGFTGVDKLDIAFNNNISFASTEAKGDKNEVDKSLAMLRYEGDTENYFSLYNGLSVIYKISDSFKLLGQLSNNLVTYDYSTNLTKKDKDDGVKDNKVSATYDSFALYLGVEYGVVPGKATLRGGLDMVMASLSHDAFGSTVKDGTFTIGIPLGILVTF